MVLPTSLILLATAFGAALAVPLEERDVSDILADITAVDTELVRLSTQLYASRDLTSAFRRKNALKSDLNSLANTGASGLSDIGVHSNRVIADFQKATAASTANGPVSEADGQTIAAHVRPPAQDLIEVLSLYVANKPVFDDLSNTVPNLISNTEETLEDMAQAIEDFVNEIVKNGPADVVSADAPLRSTVAASLATAVATFQS